MNAPGRCEECRHHVKHKDDAHSLTCPRRTPEDIARHEGRLLRIAVDALKRHPCAAGGCPHGLGGGGYSECCGALIAAIEALP